MATVGLLAGSLESADHVPGFGLGGSSSLAAGAGSPAPPSAPSTVRFSEDEGGDDASDLEAALFADMSGGPFVDGVRAALMEVDENEGSKAALRQRDLMHEDGDSDGESHGDSSETGGCETPPTPLGTPMRRPVGNPGVDSSGQKLMPTLSDPVLPLVAASSSPETHSDQLRLDLNHGVGRVGTRVPPRVGVSDQRMAMAATYSVAANLERVPAASSNASPAQLLASKVLLQPQAYACMAVFDLHCNLDVVKLARAVPNSIYDPTINGLGKHGLIIRLLRPPLATSFLMKSGKVRIYTSYHGEQARIAAKRIARLVQRHQAPHAVFKDYRVMNVMCIAQLPSGGIDLEAYICHLRESTHLTDIRPVEISESKILLQVDSDDGRVTVQMSPSGLLQVNRSKSYDIATAAMAKIASDPGLKRFAKWW